MGCVASMVNDAGYPVKSFEEVQVNSLAKWNENKKTKVRIHPLLAFQRRRWPGRYVSATLVEEAP